VRDSGEVCFTPLTVFIGNNGSGKSSLIEGLKAFRDVSSDDLVEVMQGWHGYENIRYQGVSGRLVAPGKTRTKIPKYENPISFEATGRYDYGLFKAKMEVGLGADRYPIISREEIRVGREVEFTRDARGVVRFKGKAPSEFGSVNIQPSIRMD